MDEWTEADLLGFADAIGQMVERGNLPPHDENGFYDFSRAPEVKW